MKYWMMELLEILKAKFGDWWDGEAVIEAVHVLSEFHFHATSNNCCNQPLPRRVTAKNKDKGNLQSIPPRNLESELKQQ